MRVRLVRKFANALNGIDLSKVSVGDVINLLPHQAALLVAEGWAVDASDTRGSAPVELALDRTDIGANEK